MNRLLVLLSAILAAIGSAFWTGHKSGRARERERITKQESKNAKEAAAVDHRISDLSDDELARRLRKYQRD